MKAITTLFATLAVLVAAIPALAQQPPPLPALPGYPITEHRADPIYTPTIWADVDSLTAFHSACTPGSMSVYQESTGVDLLHIPEPCSFPYGWKYPDVFDQFVAAEEVRRGAAGPTSRIASIDLVTGHLYDLSGARALNRRVSLGDSWAVWEHGATDLAINHRMGTPASMKVLTGLFSGTPSWPNIWHDLVVFELDLSPAATAIALLDLTTEHLQVVTSASPGLGRYAPHIADGRVAYHVRDVPGSPAGISEIAYMEFATWGTERTPAFRGQVPCQQTSAPRIGGEKGRFILFTGLFCGPKQTHHLYLGDLVTNNAYLVDDVAWEPDTSIERPFYDIQGDTIVYQTYTGTSSFKVLKIDVSAL